MEKMKEELLDILITGGKLITMSDDYDILNEPLVGIKNGIITYLAKRNDTTIPLPPAREVIDAKDCVIMPGLVNTHTHLPMVSFRGLADDLPLMDWLNKYIFPAEARYVNREMVYSGSRLAMAEMILSGTTTFCDGYFFESSVAQAALDSGMRAVVAQGFIDLPAQKDPDSSAKIEIAEGFAKRWKKYIPQITPAFFCHAPYSCSPDTLRIIKETATKEGVLFLTHLLEIREEEQIIKERYGKQPLDYLIELGVLDKNTIAVHCNWVNDTDISILAKHEVKVSHNPESSMKLAAGVAPVPEMMRHGITVGLGTDGCASNNDLDLFREMDSTAKIHKVTLLDPTVMDAKTVVRLATIDGAKVLGLSDKIGSLEVGKCADIIIVDMNKPHLTPLYNIYSQLVYAACGSDVKTSIINGRIVMKDRHILSMDVTSVMEDVKKIAKDIQNTRKS